MSEVKRNIILTGFMGTGKTTVGQRLAAVLGLPFIDTDRLVEDMTGLKIPEIFRQYGEERFRSAESRAVAHASGFSGAVVATGGGVVLNPSNMRLLRESGWIILLEACPEVLARRLQTEQGRPLLQGAADRLLAIKSLLEERKPYYWDCDCRVDTSSLTVEEVVQQILAFLREWGWK